MNIMKPLLALCSVAALGGTGVILHRGQAQKAVILKTTEALEARLAANNHQGMQAMASTVHGISVVVSKNQNQARDVAVLRASQQVLNRTRSVVDTLRLFQQQLRAAAHEAPAGALRHPDAATQPVSIAPLQLARQLDRYTAFIRPYLPGVPALTQPAPDGTAWLYDDDAPVAAALASLTRLEARVRRQATGALNLEAQKIGSHCGFDKIVAMAVSASNTVAPGATYEAQLYLTLAASGRRLVMTAAGKAVAVQPNGRGLVEIRIPPPRPGQPDTVRARWHGAIRVNTGLGDTAFQINAPYFIIKQPT